MASKYWIKLYHELLDDPKIGLLSDNLWRRTIELFLLAGEIDNEGQLPKTDEIAWRLRQLPADLEPELKELEQIGIIEANNKGWFVKNFAARQAASSSTERSRYHRQAAKSATNRPQVWDVPRNWAWQIYKDLPNTSGIYRIFCTENKVSYIGSSKVIRDRVKQHLSQIKTTTHHKLSDEFREYGPDSIKIEVLEQISDLNKLPERETYWIAYFKKNKNTEKRGKTHRNRYATNRPTDTDTDTDSLKPKGLPDNPSGPKTQIKNKFLELTNLEMPHLKKDQGFWWSKFGEILKISKDDTGKALEYMSIVVPYMKNEQLSIGGPESIIKLMRTVASGQTLNGAHKNATHQNSTRQNHTRHRTGNKPTLATGLGTATPEELREAGLNDTEIREYLAAQSSG